MPPDDGEGTPAGRRIEGYVDLVDGARVTGWAYDPQDAGRRLLIEVRAGDALGLARADRDRPDLRDAGKGDGRYGFEVRLDFEAAAGALVTVREAATGQDLVGSPFSTDLAARIAGPANRAMLATLGAEAQVLMQRLRAPAP